MSRGESGEGRGAGEPVSPPEAPTGVERLSEPNTACRKKFNFLPWRIATLHGFHRWKEGMARMFRFSKNEGITERLPAENEAHPATRCTASGMLKTAACVSVPSADRLVKTSSEWPSQNPLPPFLK